MSEDEKEQSLREIVGGMTPTPPEVREEYKPSFEALQRAAPWATDATLACIIDECDKLAVRCHHVAVTQWHDKHCEGMSREERGGFHRANSVRLFDNQFFTNWIAQLCAASIEALAQELETIKPNEPE